MAKQHCQIDLWLFGNFCSPSNLLFFREPLFLGVLLTTIYLPQRRNWCKLDRQKIIHSFICSFWAKNPKNVHGHSHKAKTKTQPLHEERDGLQSFTNNNLLNNPSVEFNGDFPFVCREVYKTMNRRRKQKKNNNNCQMVATTTQSQTNSSGKSVAATNLANKSDILM